jgi:hypothetical protein
MSSPAPQNRLVSQRLMDFFTALKLLNDGQRITKLEWTNENIYGVMRNGIVCLHKDDGVMYAWTLSDGDLNGTDWYTLG